MMENSNKKLSASIVRLNVGGVIFDTTRDTLCAAAFFIPWLEGRFDMACDEDGRLFIDRDGHLFVILLSFMRNSQRPTQKIIDAHKEALLAECDFFQIDSLPYYLRGDISPCDMKLEDRKIQEAELLDSSDDLLIDFFAVDHSPLDPALLQTHMLNSNAPRPTVVTSFNDFFESLNKFSDHLIDELSSVPSIIICGGSVIGSLVKQARSDLDIFLTCETDVAEERVKAVYDAVQRNMRRNYSDNSSLLVTRTLNAITFYQCTGRSLAHPTPIQLILKLGTSTADILRNFDVDSSCFAFVPSSQKVLCTPRGLRSVRYGANLVDTAFASKSYTRRLEKYKSRGFAIAIPGFSPELVRTDIFNERYAFFVNTGLLLRLGRCIWNRNSTTALPSIMDSCKIIPETIHRGVAVQNLEKLLILDRGPGIVKYHHNDFLRAKNNVCVPYRAAFSASRNEYVVIEGKMLQNRLVLGSQEDDLYVNMMGEVVDMILGKICGANAGEDLKTGGSVRTKQAGLGVLCVYDLVKCGSSFHELRWVLDARSQNLSPEAYERRYGFPALLGFSAIRPRCRVEDFTMNVYR